MTHTRLLEPVGCTVRHYIDEGFYKSLVETTGPQRVLTFMPTGFESTYEYPLIVFFHRDGSSERQIMRLVPHLSRRNFICMGLRGMVPMYRTDGRLGYSWDNDAGLTTELEDYVFAAIADAYDRLPVHADRIFLAGIGEGATQAYRLAFSYPNKFAGVISLNGKLPQRGPLWRLQQTRQLPVFIGHGRDNEQDRKSTRLNSSHLGISYAVFCLKKKKIKRKTTTLGRSRNTTRVEKQRGVKW